MCKYYIIKWPTRSFHEPDPQYLVLVPGDDRKGTSHDIDDATVMDRKSALEWLAANWDDTVDGYEPEMCRVRLEEA